MSEYSDADLLLNLALDLTEVGKLNEALVISRAAKALGHDLSDAVLVLVEAALQTTAVHSKPDINLVVNDANLAHEISKARARLLWRKGEKNRAIELWNADNE